ncbi:MAG: Dam family site-specific DNA-(adenine-N6)-methyltransferase [Gammaproteobacteria bacterium]|jgi:DNA adenine methylase|nr:Dam family site-specific DNA-(adenine-N6)-methyltransferase [Gammaproteobacteria bacterium]
MRQLKAILPEAKRLIEPFAGSAAVFLNTDYQHYLLAETNYDLISLYQYVQHEGLSFIEYCQAFFNTANNNSSCYYDLREQFNSTQDLRRKAALFLYLNRHGYNGLCRYNTNGGYNVPFGQHLKPYFPYKEMLTFHHKAQNAVFQHADFQTTLQLAIPGDVVYCDPPYLPLTATANFTQYSAKGFSWAEQEILAKQAEQLTNRGIPIIISNHDHPLIPELYKAARIIRFPVARSISRNGKQRKPVMEVLAIF